MFYFVFFLFCLLLPGTWYFSSSEWWCVLICWLALFLLIPRVFSTIGFDSDFDFCLWEIITFLNFYLSHAFWFGWFSSSIQSWKTNSRNVLRPSKSQCDFNKPLESYSKLHVFNISIMRFTTCNLDSKKLHSVVWKQGKTERKCQGHHCHSACLVKWPSDKTERENRVTMKQTVEWVWIIPEDTFYCVPL